MTRLDHDPARAVCADELARRPAADLLAQLLAEGIVSPPHLARGELLAALLAHRLAQGRGATTVGTLELLPEGFGFLRSAHLDYEASPHDAFVSPSQVRALNLKSGHRVSGPLRAPRGNERYFALAHVDRVNDSEPPALATRVLFAARTPIVATRPLALAPDAAAWRALGWLAPWCRGHRALVVAPPGFACGPWLAELAAALRRADGALFTSCCLLDQRPEDLAAARAGSDDDGEVLGTTFDHPPERHVTVAELALARALRAVEAGRDVVLLLDSLTALSLAAQRATPASGRWLCPGLDALAVLPAKRLFAAARACAEGGSLTVIASCVAGDGPVAGALLGEFAQRGNSEVVVDPQLAADGAAAPFDPRQTRTRPEDDDRDAATQAAVRTLRAQLAAAATPAERERLLAAPPPAR